MGEVVNLRRARKRKARGDAEAEAAARRVEFGVSETRRSVAAAERALAERRLSGLRREAGAPDPTLDVP